MATSKLFSSALFLMMSISAFSQINKSYQLPETWEKDFTIILYYYGSMRGDKTEIKFTYDSCIYLNNPRTEKPKLQGYRMTEADREGILKKLAALKADQIKSERSIHAVHDGWSQSLCLGTHCIEGGTSAEMNESDKNTFLEAYGYLEDFAIKKTRKLRK